MFILKTCSDDSKRLFSTEAAFRNIFQIKGTARLFRKIQYNITNSIPPARTVFIFAIPHYFTTEEFITFCLPYHHFFLEVVFIRNESDHISSALITFCDVPAAEGFYRCFNGLKFNDLKTEEFHVYYVQSTTYEASTKVGEVGDAYTGLPTCPVCLERLDQKTSGIQSTSCDHSFNCSCLSNWSSKSVCQVCKFCSYLGKKGPADLDEKGPACEACQTSDNLSICLFCGFVGCGRHAQNHWFDEEHYYSLELET